MLVVALNQNSKNMASSHSHSLAVQCSFSYYSRYHFIFLSAYFAAVALFLTIHFQKLKK